MKPEYLLVGGGILTVFGLAIAGIVGFVLTSMGVSTAREKREGCVAEVAAIGILIILVIAIAVLAITTH